MAVEMALVLVRRLRPGAGAGRRRGRRRATATPRRSGALLYTDYVYPFEIAAVILLVAIVAAIALTLRRRKDTQVQDPVAAGARCRRADRVRLVTMPSEKPDADAAASADDQRERRQA